ncbi:glycosyltransferase [Neobacillus sp. 19]|uniref:glycosyltransferase n=1 Tax=Neobacillus sp. 19 TaxID=3394458 RepID=UPI003BF664EA
MTEQNEVKNGVTIIICTNKIGLMENIYLNFENQKWENKELIIILNNDSLKIEDFIAKAEQYQSVTVYQLPQSYTLGECLNFGINKAKYEYIAKFDDDDYYAPSYITEAMRAFETTNADVVGKRTAYMYYLKSKQLRLRFPRNGRKWVTRVHGATLMAKKEVFKKVPFAHISLGEDVNFLLRCRQRGLKIYSTSRFNYTVIRREDGTHTWNPRYRYIASTSLRIGYTNDFKRFVDKDIN